MKTKALILNKYIRVNVRQRAFKYWLVQTSSFILLATVSNNSEKSPGRSVTPSPRRLLGAYYALLRMMQFFDYAWNHWATNAQTRNHKNAWWMLNLSILCSGLAQPNKFIAHLQPASLLQTHQRSCFVVGVLFEKVNREKTDMSPYTHTHKHTRTQKGSLLLQMGLWVTVFVGRLVIWLVGLLSLFICGSIKGLRCTAWAISTHGVLILKISLIELSLTTIIRRLFVLMFQFHFNSIAFQSSVILFSCLSVCIRCSSNYQLGACPNGDEAMPVSWQCDAFSDGKASRVQASFSFDP